MDLETESRIAAALLREASELRRQAQQEGVLAYLRKPTVRARPNSRFLTATVRGIQQVNRAVEMDEMWRVRQKELELDDKVKGRSRDYCSDSGKDGHRELSRRLTRRHDSNNSCSSSKRSYEDHSKEEEGLRDEEIEEFLRSRAKRGRGSIGSRMDETGPYLPRDLESHQDGMVADSVKDESYRKVMVGPEKPSSWKHCESSDESSDNDDHKRSKKKTSSGRTKKHHYKKHKSKEKSRDKKKKKKDRRYKH